jgi:predicted HAD superfamily phosphohydrolase YqeG
MTARGDWLTTAAQTLPRFARLVTRLRPTFHVASAAAVDRRFLAEHGISAVLWDVDGTLMPYHHLEVAPELLPALAALRGHVPQAILSNCGEERLLELGRVFEDLPVLKAYRADGGALVVRHLEGGRERWSTGTGAARADVARPVGRLVPLKKPSAELVGLALDRLDVAAPAQALMVGDQYFTDVAGANLAGIRSAKVETHAPATFPVVLRAFQGVERALYRLLHGRAPALLSK